MSSDMRVSHSPQHIPAASAATAAQAPQNVRTEASVRELSSGPGAPASPAGARGSLGASPSMPAPAAGAVDASAITASLSKVSMTDISRVLFETSKELRDANREMRHASRDAAVMEANVAADKIRSGGLKSMIFGIVAGAIGVASGAFSMYQGAGQVKSLAKMDTNANTVAGQFKQTKADTDLGAAQAQYMEYARGGDLPHGTTEADLRNDILMKADKAGANNPNVKNDLNAQIGAKQNELRGTTDPTRQAQLQTEIDDLSLRRDMYNDPLGPNSMEAGIRFADKNAGSVRPGGELFENHSLASGKAATLRTDIQIKGVKMQGINAAGSGASQLVQGVGGFVSAGEQAESSEATARAEEAKSTESEMAEYQKSFDELLKSVMDIVRKFSESQTQANAAIIKNM